MPSRSALGAANDNIIEVGEAVEARMEELKSRLPLGVELHPLYEQHHVVNDAINDFLLNLAMSVAIVIGVLCLAMGWRIGVVVGSTLLLTVLGTLLFMGLLNIEMERISLGALIIAMGMLVDNAIVVAEGMVTNIKRGQRAKEAAGSAAKRAQLPLLGATVIGIMAFAGIGLSDDVTGEFLYSLFMVILVSLMLSWLLAITVTPLFGYYLLRQKGDDEDQPADEQQADEHQDENENDDEPSKRELYGGLLYRAYRRVLLLALGMRIITVSALVLITAVCLWAFSLIPQSFFPDSNTPLFFVNVELPQGTDIARPPTTPPISRRISWSRRTWYRWPASSARALPASCSPTPRSSPTPPMPSSSCAPKTWMPFPRWTSASTELNEAFPSAQVRTQRLQFGPGDGADIEARFQGPSPEVLRSLADQAQRIMADSPYLIDQRTDWRQQELVVRPRINEERARIAGVSREDITQTLQFASSGIRAGTYREGEHLLPIVARHPAAERDDVALLENRNVWSAAQQRFVPISQVVSSFDTDSEEALIQRRNRVRTLTVGADAEGYTAAQAFGGIREEIEAMTLPPGYQLSWEVNTRIPAMPRRRWPSSCPLACW